MSSDLVFTNFNHVREIATASYRIHPYIKLIKQPPPYLARKFANCFSPGVVKVLDEGTRMLLISLRAKSKLITLAFSLLAQSHVEVDTSQMRGESMSREVFRHSEFEGCVELTNTPGGLTEKLLS